MISGSIYALFFCLVPETSAPTILYYRAKRLRQITGDESLRSEEEVKQRDNSLSSRLWFSLIKPWEINLKDPALLFTTFYFGLLYGILYSFFEASTPDTNKPRDDTNIACSLCRWCTRQCTTSQPRLPL